MARKRARCVIETAVQARSAFTIKTCRPTGMKPQTWREVHYSYWLVPLRPWLDAEDLWP